MAIFEYMIETNLKKISRRLKAIGDPTRIKLLYLLSIRPACVCELTEALGLAQPTISRHLRQLEDVGFVTGNRERNWTIYELAPMEECCRQLLEIVVSRIRNDLEIQTLKGRFLALDRAEILKQRTNKQRVMASK